MANEENEILDLDDPSLKEPQSYDPEADYNAFVPAPELNEEGKVIEYQLKLALGENRFHEKKMYFKKSPKVGPFGVLMVDMSIVQPGGLFDKFKLKAEYLNTIVDRKKNTSSVVDLCRLLKTPMPKGLDLSSQGEFVESLLASEPTINGTLQWTAYCRNCEEEIGKLAGERNWPVKKDENGKVIGHLAKTECPACGADITPGVRCRGFVE